MGEHGRIERAGGGHRLRWYGRSGAGGLIHLGSLQVEGVATELVEGAQGVVEIDAAAALQVVTGVDAPRGGGALRRLAGARALVPRRFQN